MTLGSEAWRSPQVGPLPLDRRTDWLGWERETGEQRGKCRFGCEWQVVETRGVCVHVGEGGRAPEGSL